MAWRCSALTNEQLIVNLHREGIIKHTKVADAFKAVDRADYVLLGLHAYQDAPQPIGFGATISAPHMHAYAVEGLLPLLKPGANVLDIGCGSGYLLAVFHHLVSPGGTVLGIDHLQGLIDLSRTNLARAPRTLAALNSSSPSIQLYCEDGRKGSPPELTPAGGWDAIHVGAAAPHLPEELVAQLASPGRMFVPVGTGSQAIWQVDKNEAGEIHRQRLFGVNYIPLTDADRQYH